MKPTLGQIFGLSLLGLAIILAVLFYIVFHESQETIIESSNRIRDGASREISQRVTTFLSRAPETARQFQWELNRGLLDARDHLALEAALFGLLLSNRDTSELTFTYGEKTGFDADGALQLAATPRGQISVVRSSIGQDDERWWSRHIKQEAGGFVSDRRELESSARFSALPLHREARTDIPDPTAHPTFTTPARQDFFGQLLWSDLHWSQLDAELPPWQRRAEVSVQQAMTDADGEFVGVLRVGLLTQQLDRAVQLRLATNDQNDPHRIFICDAQGRLITPLSPFDRLQEFGDDLRIAPKNLPPEVAGALANPMLRAVGETRPSMSGHFRLNGEEFLTTFRALPETQGWIVGIVVPRAYYLGRLAVIRNRLLLISLGIIAALIVGGTLILRRVKSSLARVTRESLKMDAFEFTPAPTTSSFRDVSEVLESLEKAKTAMRAMSKYVPVDLVRRLYRSKTEPVLGGELTELSIMFADIKDFTTYSEQLEPNELARALGRYLDVMARIIQQETGGTIDKFIGDAIMTFWNAPEPVADHARKACLAALRCREAGHALSKSTDWQNLPPFETRFGLHQDKAMVGHFGAPDRMNYTAIGDGINLASRLEGLNKQYGTTILASDRIVEDARAQFDFRLLDLVAVKGKTGAIKIYELLGEKNTSGHLSEKVAAYEAAFDAYVMRDFAQAIAILKQNNGDPPSAVLLNRCLEFQKAPPPADWHGVHVSMSK
ncbi:MAG TPA: adenylate/guanylate cyclase domain-containing protein [Candidatus Tectomicrobia bacterium]|nr:adenylate/guanylate cyclase domain-containing protein [Candidatus Tectomicrobia bacterium]